MTLRTKQERERYEREEREARETVERPHRERIENLERQIREAIAARVKQAYSLPILTLLKKMEDIAETAKAGAEGLLNALLGDFADVDPDSGIVYVMRPEGHERVDIAEFRAVYAFIEELPESGYVLEQDGKARLAIYAQVQSVCGADMTNASNVEQAYKRLFSLGCFAENELKFNPSKVQKKPDPPKAPAPEPEVDIEAIDTSTREGQAIAKHQVTKEVFTNEARPIWQAWRESLLDNFGYVMDENVQRHAYQTFTDLNLSFLDRRSYDRVRLILVGQGLMPETCLTPEDKLARSIENASTPTENYFQRRNIRDAISAVKSLNPIPEPKE